VIDDSNATSLLLSNKLDPGRQDKNPLSGMVVRNQPTDIGRLVSANFDDRVELLGVTMPEHVARGSTFEVSLFFKVLQPVGRNWKIFVHFDGGGLRFQGDHDPTRGRCGTSFWQAGDYIIDTFEVKAGDVTYPKTAYSAWVGFFVGSSGNWTNMTVKSGNPDSNNRVPIGTIEVD
jgi:hypothetical protein